MVALLVACFGEPPESAATPPLPPLVVAFDPGCDTPDTCAAVCDRGGAIACNRLALWLHDGIAGAPLDPIAAAERYRQSCALGAGIGCYNLAHQKAGGQGIPADPVGAQELLAKAYTAYRASCDAGGIEWCSNLAGLVERGEGTPRDPVAALALFASACERGSSDACVAQARMLQQGDAGPPDVAAAEAILRRTCDGSDRGDGACNNLAKLLEARGEDPRPLLRASCDRGTAVACRNLALLSPDRVEALAQLVRACEAPSGVDGLGCALAAGLLMEAPADPARATAYFQRACSVGISEACLDAVGVGMEFGTVTPDQGRALVERACGLGNPEACSALGGQAP